MNNIIIELCAEDRARIDAVITALEKLQTPTKAKAPKVEANEETPTTTTPEAEAPAEYPIGETPFDMPGENAPDPVTPVIDRADVQRLVVELSAAGKKAEVKEIVMAYADRVSAIPEDKLAEVFEKLNTLGG